eukprot:SAG22_NODE_18553_length_285_cov_1.021505_1_plen_66_part_10
MALSGTATQGTFAQLMMYGERRLLSTAVRVGSNEERRQHAPPLPHDRWLAEQVAVVQSSWIPVREG